MQLMIEQLDSGKFYVFEDIAGELCPRFDNHCAEEIVVKRLVRNGCARVMQSFTSPGHLNEGYETPGGIIAFDSEAMMFECHSLDREAVEYVVGVIEEIDNEIRSKEEAR